MRPSQGYFRDASDPFVSEVHDYVANILGCFCDNFSSNPDFFEAKHHWSLLALVDRSGHWTFFDVAIWLFEHSGMA